MAQTKTIAVAMSGGVDSSTVAAILAHASTGESAERRSRRCGADAAVVGSDAAGGEHGIPDAPKAGRCCTLDDVYDARRVAEHLGIPYYVVNQEERFEQDVVRPFVKEYLAGRTPIPCSLCNDHIKFDQLLRTARSIGADSIATGHYAVNEYDAERGRWILKRPADRAKDQTYFLFGLTQEQLAHTLFPLGKLTKPEVREVARRARAGAGGEARLAGDLFYSWRRLQAVFDGVSRGAGRGDAGDGGRTGGIERRSDWAARGDFQLHRRTAQGAGRGFAFAALCAADRSGEPSRDGGSGCRVSDAHVARGAIELDQHRCPDRADAGADQDSPPA